MEPLSILSAISEAAAVAGYAFRTAKALQDAFQGVKDVRVNVRHAANLLGLISTSLERLKDELQRRSGQFPWESRHHKAILAVLKNCCDDLDRLQAQLTKIPASERSRRGGAIEFVRNIPLALQQYIREDRKIFQRLQEALSVLQWSIVTVSAPITWDAPQQHQQTLEEVRRLGKALSTYATDNPLPRRFLLGNQNDSVSDILLLDGIDADQGQQESEQDKRSQDDIKVWVNSAFDVTDEVATNRLSRNAAPLRLVQLARRGSVEEPGMSRDSLATPTLEQLRLREGLARAKVSQLTDLSLYYHATIYQRKRIRFREELERACDVPFHLMDRVDMELQLSDLLLRCDALDYTHEALEIMLHLDSVLEAAAPEFGVEPRLGVLYTIGKTYLLPEIEDASLAFESLQKAINGYLGQEIVDPQEVNEVFATFARAGHMCNIPLDVASAEIQLQSKLGDKFEPPRQELALALQWCREHYFTVDGSPASIMFNHLKDEQENTPFHVAARECGLSLQILQELLCRKDSLSELDGNGDSALFVAIDESNFEAIRMFLDNGADLHFRHPKKNQTVLHRLQMCRDRSIIQLIFDKLKTRRWSSISDDSSMAGPTDMPPTSPGPDAEEKQTGIINVDDQDWYERTALLEASTQGNVFLVSELLKAGADPNVVDVSDRSPLLEACSGSMGSDERRNIIKLLVNHYADTKHKDSEGKDAASLLKKRTNLKKSEITELLACQRDVEGGGRFRLFGRSSGEKSQRGSFPPWPFYRKVSDVVLAWDVPLRSPYRHRPKRNAFS
ncbi:hypothetical protein GQ53DRAFT_878503 [Thozetella sp. PMI_491]|nr:hypothetical protein GQ53DRAFT_878503 [Thozetella sp. PMI_491]